MRFPRSLLDSKKPSHAPTSLLVEAWDESGSFRIALCVVSLEHPTYSKLVGQITEESKVYFL